MSNSYKFTLRNFRCFDWDNPATLVFGDGFTALVGPNNSGKSSALRSVYELRNYLAGLFVTVRGPNGYRLNSAFIGISDATELANDNAPGSFQFSLEIPDGARSAFGSASLAVGGVFEIDIGTLCCRAVQVRCIGPGGGEWILSSADITTGALSNQDGVITYSARSQEVDYSQLFDFGRDLAASKYFPAFRNAINEGAGSYYDLPVGTALVETWDSWKAGNIRMQKISISRVEAEIAKLLGFRSLQINADRTNKTLDVIINERPHKLYEVGAGVAQLIIVLAAALISKPPYILIDEPELSLHPSLQVSFLATLGSYSQKGLVYSTHSIGLARSTAQRIFTTCRLSNGFSGMQPFGTQNVNLAEWLGELNYSNRAELGCDGIILVEGTTDVLFFQEFLRKISKDGKYVVMPLGGSSLINASIGVHIDELTRIVETSKIRVFIDSERKSKDEALASDRIAFVSECEKRGVEVTVSERRATENYLEINGIRAVLGDGFQELGHYEKLKESAKPWHKSENWKIARETSLTDIKDTDFGEFLHSL